MECPGCGAEVPEGSKYCNICGGKISGSTVDYSQMRNEASDVYDVSSSDTSTSGSFDEYDENVADVMWVKFALLLVGLPIMTFISIVAGFEEKRTDLLYVGAFLLALSILAIALAFKFYKGEDGGVEKEQTEPVPRFFRRT